MSAKIASDDYFLSIFEQCDGNLSKLSEQIGMSVITARNYANRLGVFKPLNENHGYTTRDTKSRIYVTWQNMKRRCLNRNAEDFNRYGAKGITVCDEWKDSFNNFKDWAFSHGYSDDLTIDRINSARGYCPENCRFVPKHINSREGKSTTKLSMEKARMIRCLKRNGFTVNSLTAVFCVSEGAVRGVVNNRCWREDANA